MGSGNDGSDSVGRTRWWGRRERWWGPGGRTGGRRGTAAHSRRTPRSRPPLSAPLSPLSAPALTPAVPVHTQLLAPSQNHFARTPSTISIYGIRHHHGVCPGPDREGTAIPAIFRSHFWQGVSLRSSEQTLSGGQ